MAQKVRQTCDDITSCGFVAFVRHLCAGKRKWRSHIPGTPHWRLGGEDSRHTPVRSPEDWRQEGRGSPVCGRGDGDSHVCGEVIEVVVWSGVRWWGGV